MAKNPSWHDDYWLMLMEIYLRKPVGVKPVYSRALVDLSMELHIAPELLHRRMCQLSHLKTPRIERIWNTYSKDLKKLERAVSLLREMKGFGLADQFYDGVEVNETFEKDFKPLDEDSRLTPVMLILVLDLYFRLAPTAMESKTPEVVELARLLKLNPAVVQEVLEVYQHCDPYLNRRDVSFSQLLLPCQRIWQRYGNGDTAKLEAKANELKEYF